MMISGNMCSPGESSRRVTFDLPPFHEPDQTPLQEIVYNTYTPVAAETIWNFCRGQLFPREEFRQYLLDARHLPVFIRQWDDNFKDYWFTTMSIQSDFSSDQKKYMDRWENENDEFVLIKNDFLRLDQQRAAIAADK